MKLLLEKGADVHQDMTNQWGSSALAAAVRNGSMAIIDFLLEHGANPNDASALQEAVMLEHDEVVKKLVELSINVNAASHALSIFLGYTAVASASSPSMTDYLAAHGADVNGAVYDNGGATAVQRAAAHHSSEMLEKLICLGGDVNAPAAAIRGRTALGAVAFSGKAYHIRFLVDKHGAVINSPRGLGRPNLSALEAVAHWRAKKQTEKSNIQGTEAEESKSGSSAQDVEQEKSSSLSTVEFLLDRGAELTATPLHIAAAWGDEELGDLLLKRGADPNLPPNILLDNWIIRFSGHARDMESTVFETARLNMRAHFLQFLENWYKVHGTDSDNDDDDDDDDDTE